MSCTVACFCGNVYVAPPDRCDVCGRSIDSADSGDRATSQAPDAGEMPGLAAERSHHRRPVFAPPPTSEEQHVY